MSDTQETTFTTSIDDRIKACMEEATYSAVTYDPKRPIALGDAAITLEKLKELATKTFDEGTVDYIQGVQEFQSKLKKLL